jgi:hypothetical protein
VVDALRRRVHEFHATSIRMYQTYFKDTILYTANSNSQYMEIVTKLQQGILQQKVEDYKLGEDEVLMYKEKIYVPNSHELKNLILR